MAGIGTIVSIRRSNEYGGKYAGKLGIVKKLADDPAPPLLLQPAANSHAQL